VLLDVRSSGERAQKRIDGSLHIPLNHLTDRLSEIPRDRAVLLHCAGGYRSSIAASLLKREGFTGVSELAGGIAAWETAGLPTRVDPET
jgi:rhodanese-related sulfurtransferase